MYGHGAAPPPPSAASVITQRVLYAAAGVLCCGLLACLPLFRIAFLRGRPLDWAAAWVSIPLSIACLAVVGSLPESDVRTDIALALVLILGACASAYYLTVDIRLHRRPGGPYAAPVPPSPHATTMPTPGPHAPYGYQQPVSPYTPTPVPGCGGPAAGAPAWTRTARRAPGSRTESGRPGRAPWWRGATAAPGPGRGATAGGGGCPRSGSTRRSSRPGSGRRPGPRRSGSPTPAANRPPPGRLWTAGGSPRPSPSRADAPAGTRSGTAAHRPADRSTGLRRRRTARAA